MELSGRALSCPAYMLPWIRSPLHCQKQINRKAKFLIAPSMLQCCLYSNWGLESLCFVLHLWEDLGLRSSQKKFSFCILYILFIINMYLYILKILITVVNFETRHMNNLSYCKSSLSDSMSFVVASFLCPHLQGCFQTLAPWQEAQEGHCLLSRLPSSPCEIPVSIQKYALPSTSPWDTGAQ